MDRMLTHEAKIQLASSLRRRYQAATSRAKKQILAEFVAVSGYHPKYAIRLLNAAETNLPAPRARVRWQKLGDCDRATICACLLPIGVVSMRSAD
jgi:hypothetical protein